MKKSALFLVMSAFVLQASATAETWKNVVIVDAMCSAKAKAEPDQHTAKCALACAKSGFGILTADGSFLKFDAAGNEKAVIALRNSKKADHLRATVSGTRDGDTVKVQALALE